MYAVSIGDMSQTFLQRLQNTDLKMQLDNLTQELSTGKTSDLSTHLSGDYSALSGIDRSLSSLVAYNNVITEATLQSASMQSSLESIQDRAQGLSSAFLTAISTSEESAIESTSADAMRALQDTLSNLNTRVSDRSLFSGTATDSAAVVDVDTLMTEIGIAIAGATTPTDVLAAVSGWFDDPAGYGALGYKGGDVRPDLRTGPDSDANLRVTANTEEIKEMLEALVVAALPDSDIFNGTFADQMELARVGSTLLLQADTGITKVRADVGRAEADLETARARNRAETTALNVSRSNLISVDPYQAATELEAVQLQLEMFYTVTSRLSRLSLADYI